MNIVLKISDEAIELLELYKNDDCPLEVWNHTPDKAVTLLNLQAWGLLFKQKIGYAITPFGEAVLLLHKEGCKENTFDV